MSEPIRFFAVSHGNYDDYCEYYILATSSEDAIRRFLKSNNPPYNVVGTVWEADLDDFGVIHKSKELYDVELPGERGYLWEEDDEVDLKFGINRCLLCGHSARQDEDKDTFLNENRKCANCAKYKLFKL